MSISGEHAAVPWYVCVGVHVCVRACVYFFAVFSCFCLHACGCFPEMPTYFFFGHRFKDEINIKLDFKTKLNVIIFDRDYILKMMPKKK